MEATTAQWSGCNQPTDVWKAIRIPFRLAVLGALRQGVSPNASLSASQLDSAWSCSSIKNSLAGGLC